jgi:glycosyl transferase family 2
MLNMTTVANPTPNRLPEPIGPDSGSSTSGGDPSLDPVLPGLCVVLPCFDEEDNVADAIRAAAVAAARTSLDYEIIVVDDGSTDATAAAVAPFLDGSRRVRLLVHPANRGYGAALRTGIEAARLSWVLLTDADLQFDLQDLEDFVRLSPSADLIAGRRVLRSDSLARRMNGAAWSWLVRRMFRLPVRDVDCAFKLVRREILEQLTLTSAGAMISVELLVKSRAAGACIVEHGVHHRPRVAGEQTGARPRVVLRAFRELVAQRRALRRLSRPAAMA